MARHKLLVAMALGAICVGTADAQERRYRVTGGGIIEIDLPGYHGKSSYEYDEVLTQSELDDWAMAQADSVDFVVNGVPLHGGGELRLFTDGFVESAAIDGPFFWEFREYEGIAFVANGIRCVYEGRDLETHRATREPP